MEKAVYDRELDEEIESFGKRRDERDKKVVDGVKKKVVQIKTEINNYIMFVSKSKTVTHLT